MSAKSEQLNGEGEGADEVCASCGTAAVDDVTLKKCACNLVKYCSVDCQKNHRSRHKNARRDWLNCMIKDYLRSPISATWESVRFVVCRCQFIRVNQS
jgi:hypothetical protein